MKKKIKHSLQAISVGSIGIVSLFIFSNFFPISGENTGLLLGNIFLMLICILTIIVGIKGIINTK